MTLLNRSLSIIILLIYCFQSLGCGTILYPERRNKNPGRLDVGVVLLDGIWLIFGIIPGLIAYAVDFSTGAIYIPEDKGRAGSDKKSYRIVRFDPNNTTAHKLEAIISKETGQDFNFSDKRYTIVRANDKNELDQYLASAQ